MKLIIRIVITSLMAAMFLKGANAVFGQSEYRAGASDPLIPADTKFLDDGIFIYYLKTDSDGAQLLTKLNMDTNAKQTIKLGGSSVAANLENGIDPYKLLKINKEIIAVPLQLFEISPWYSINAETLEVKKTVTLDENDRLASLYHNLVVYDDWIVFSAQGNNIYKMKSDFTEKSLVLAAPIERASVQLFTYKGKLYLAQKKKDRTIELFLFDLSAKSCKPLANLGQLTTALNRDNISFKNDMIIVHDINELRQYTLDGKFIGNGVFSTLSYPVGGMSKRSDKFIEAYIKCRSIAKNAVNENMSEEEKVKALHDYVAKSYVYDHENIKNPGYSAMVYGAVINGKAVCYGFAETMNVLLDIVGIENRIITGRANHNSEPHGWNIVKVDGQYYHIDVTWALASEHNGTISYDYYMRSDSEMSQSHNWDS